MKITVETWYPDRDDFWKAYFGDEWTEGSPMGIGTSVNSAIGFLVASAYRALDLKLPGPEPLPGDAKAVLGGIVLGNAEVFGVEVKIKGGKNEN